MVILAEMIGEVKKKGGKKKANCQMAAEFIRLE